MDHEMLGSKDVMTRPELLVSIPVSSVQFIQPLVPQGEPLPLLRVVNMVCINRGQTITAMKARYRPEERVQQVQIRGLSKQ
jgi:hypothetical protein